MKKKNKRTISPKRSTEIEKPCSREFIVAAADKRFCIKGSTPALWWGRSWGGDHRSLNNALTLQLWRGSTGQTAQTASSCVVNFTASCDLWIVLGEACGLSPPLSVLQALPLSDFPAACQVLTLPCCPNLLLESETVPRFCAVSTSLLEALTALILSKCPAPGLGLWPW